MTSSPVTIAATGSRQHLTPARAVAITVIVLAVAALVTLRFASGKTAVTVPPGARRERSSCTRVPTQPRTANRQPTAARSSSRKTARTRTRG